MAARAKSTPPPVDVPPPPAKRTSADVPPPPSPYYSNDISSPPAKRTSADVPPPPSPYYSNDISSPPTRRTSADVPPPPSPFSGTPSSVKQLLFDAEAGDSGYGAYNRGSAGDSGGKSIDFSKLTVGEIKRLQALPKDHPDRLYAVGAYQMIPSTFDQITRELKIGDDELLTNELQDKLLVQGLIPKQPELYNYLTSEEDLGASTGQVGLSKEWASVADPHTGESRYGGVGNNHATVLSDRALPALELARKNVRAAMAAGASVDEALMLGITGDGVFDTGKVRVEDKPPVDPPPPPIKPLSAVKADTLNALNTNPDDKQAKIDMAAIDLIEKLDLVDGNTSDQIDAAIADDVNQTNAELARARELYDNYSIGLSYDSVG